MYYQSIYYIELESYKEFYDKFLVIVNLITSLNFVDFFVHLIQSICYFDILMSGGEISKLSI